MVRSNKGNDEDIQKNNLDSSIYKSPPVSTHTQIDINNLIVIGTIKVDEHSRLTFSKRIKSVFPIFPQDTIVVYQNLTNKDLMFKVQRFNEVSDTWIIKRENNNIIPFSNANDLKKIPDNNKLNSDSEYKEIKKLLPPTTLPIQQQQQSKKDANIMIVDDDIDVVDTFKSILLELNEGTNEKQYNIDSFCSSKDALTHFLAVNGENKYFASNYDLVILDVKMPDINGVQLYQILKIIDPNVKVLFISALDAIVDVAGILPGIKSEDIIKKPVDIEHFFIRVQEKINL